MDAQRRPGVDGRVDVAERPLVGGQLSVRVHVPLAAHQHQLILGERGIHMGERDAVEGEIPCRIPGVLPRVRHGDDIHVVQVRPLVVASLTPHVGDGWPGRIAVEPAADVVVVELLRPEHPAERLAGDEPLVLRDVCGNDLGVELVGLPLARGHDRVEVVQPPGRSVAQPKLDRRGLPGLDLEAVPERRPGAELLRIDGRRTVDDVVADPVLRIRRRRGDAEEPLGVRLVLAEERLRRAAAQKPSGAERVMLGDERAAARANRRLPIVDSPRPRVAEPERR